MAGKHVLFEEDGTFKAGTILSDAGASLQIESATGKRTKVKATSVMLRFNEPSPSELMQRAQHEATEVDLDFLWECAPQDEFEFTALARDYFGEAPTAVQCAALLLRVHSAPVYFYRKGKGRYRPAPPDTLRAALAALDRKKEQAARIEAWAVELAEGRAPEQIVTEAARLLARPDKNSTEWKALDRACALTRSPPARVLLAAGAFADARALHMGCFLAEHFPRGPGFAPIDPAELDAALEAAMADLPLAEVQPFSIDDSTTTEIDDCLSVQTLPDGRTRIGVHIAAPALAVGRDSAFDRVARDRMSTVYMPGDKITMLPDAPIERFSLEAGRIVPALSLYVDLEAGSTRIESSFSQVERIRVAANLRHDQLDARISEDSLEFDPACAGEDPLAGFEQASALRVLWRFTLALCAERERVRGKPEPRFRVDFSFYVDIDDEGRETVRIQQRRRDAPLDRIVAELMILANSEWGRLLADHRAPGIYRAQSPGGRVAMTTQAAPHQGLGVAQYAWSTSPLRRYVDLLNQRQLIAVTRGDTPQYPQGDSEIFAVISGFDTRYAAYAEFQQRMERYWCLRWVAQQGASRFEAQVVRDDLVKLVEAPLFVRMPELSSMHLPHGQAIVIDILECDELDLAVSARFVSLTSAAPQTGGLPDALDEDDGDGSPALVDGAMPGSASGALDESVEAVDSATDSSIEPPAAADPQQGDSPA